MVILSLCLIAWPWINVIVLRFLFGQSMRRAKVRSTHVVRCVVYSHDLSFWWGLSMMGVAVISIWIHVDGKALIETRLFLRLARYAAILCAVGISYRLWQGYRLYMGFDWAWATILSAQIIIFLSLGVLLIFWLGD